MSVCETTNLGLKKLNAKSMAQNAKKNRPARVQAEVVFRFVRTQTEGQRSCMLGYEDTSSGTEYFGL